MHCRCLPAWGVGFATALTSFVKQLREGLMSALGDERYLGQVRKETETLQSAVEVEISALQAEARQFGLISCRLNRGTWLGLWGWMGSQRG